MEFITPWKNSNTLKKNRPALKTYFKEELTSRIVPVTPDSMSRKITPNNVGLHGSKPKLKLLSFTCPITLKLFFSLLR